MNTSEPTGYVTTSEYFRLRDDDTESDSDTETDSESDLGIDSINVGMLRGYMKPKCYKKILIEEELLPD